MRLHGPRWNRKEVSCTNCNITLEIPRWSLARSKNHFCSKSCFAKFKVGKPAHNLGVPASPEARLKQSLAKRGKMPANIEQLRGFAKQFHGKYSVFKKGFTPWNKGKAMSEETREKVRQARLRQVTPRKDTKIEVAIQNELQARSIPFVKHYPILGQPDIAFPERKIAVFCDGRYWHSLPKSIERDERVNGFLIENGWLVLRYGDDEILANVSGCVDEIQDVLFSKVI